MALCTCVLFKSAFFVPVFCLGLAWLLLLAWHGCCCCWLCMAAAAAAGFCCALAAAACFQYCIPPALATQRQAAHAPQWAAQAGQVGNLQTHAVASQSKMPFAHTRPVQTTVRKCICLLVPLLLLPALCTADSFFCACRRHAVQRGEAPTSPHPTPWMRGRCAQNTNARIPDCALLHMHRCVHALLHLGCVVANIARASGALVSDPPGVPAFLRPPAIVCVPVFFLRSPSWRVTRRAPRPKSQPA